MVESANLIGQLGLPSSLDNNERRVPLKKTNLSQIIYLSQDILEWLLKESLFYYYFFNTSLTCVGGRVSSIAVNGN